MPVSFDGQEFVAADLDEIDDDEPVDEALERIVHNGKKYVMARHPACTWSPVRRAATCPAPMAAWRSLIPIADDVTRITVGVAVEVGVGEALYTETLEHEASNNYTGNLQLRLAGPGFDGNIADEVDVQPISIDGDWQYYELTAAIPQRARGTVQNVAVFQRDAVGNTYSALGNTEIATDGELLPEFRPTNSSGGFPYPNDFDPSHGWVVVHDDEGGQALPIAWNEANPDGQEVANELHLSWPCHKIDDAADAWAVFAGWMSIQSVHVDLERADSTVSTDLSRLRGGDPYRAQDASHVHGREIERDAARTRMSAIGQKDWEPEDDERLTRPSSLDWADGECARFGWYLPNHQSDETEVAAIPGVSTRKYPGGTALEIYASMCCAVNAGDKVRVGRDEEYDPAQIMADAGQIKLNLDYRAGTAAGSVIASKQVTRRLPLIPRDITGAWPLLQMHERSGASAGFVVSEHFREGYLHPVDFGLLTITHETLDLTANPDGPINVFITLLGASVVRRPDRGLVEVGFNLLNNYSLNVTDVAVWEQPQ